MKSRWREKNDEALFVCRSIGYMMAMGATNVNRLRAHLLVVMVKTMSKATKEDLQEVSQILNKQFNVDLPGLTE